MNRVEAQTEGEASLCDPLLGFVLLYIWNLYLFNWFKF